VGSLLLTGFLIFEQNIVVYWSIQGGGRMAERLRCVVERITYEEVSQTFTDAAAAGVEFWEIQMNFRPEGVTLYSVKRSEDL
jgi:hypothetical protein